MSDATLPEKVHLVGSIGLDTVDEVFSTAGRLLGRRLKRIPDGEPGGRRLWIGWQAALLRANPFLKVANPSGDFNNIWGQLKIADGVKPEDVHFGELGYAREARASYLDFLEARKRGDIAPGTRFMVALPTPTAVVGVNIVGEAIPAVEKAYTEAMIREVDALAAGIPHKDLAIQWDVCFEMCWWDGQSDFLKFPFPNGKQVVTAQLKRLGEAVPADVELGYHLCYGDLDAKHFFNPKDAGAMVDLANAISAAVDRPVNFIHMPVPIDRTDDAFFKPFDDLEVKPHTEIYLGMVHRADGVEGLKKRLAAAQKHIQGFGIATECGIGRGRSPQVAREFLTIHAQGSTEPARA